VNGPLGGAILMPRPTAEVDYFPDRGLGERQGREADTHSPAKANDQCGKSTLLSDRTAEIEVGGGTAIGPARKMGVWDRIPLPVSKASATNPNLLPLTRNLLA
jgi:hypothetical protein